MPQVSEQTQVAEVASKYRVSAELSQQLVAALAQMRQSKVAASRAQKIYDLINSLPGMPPFQQQEVIEQVLVLLGKHPSR